MGIRKKCLIITLLCFSSLMYASEFMFKHLEVKDGLSNNQVLDIFKDSEGFMWFATASGLNRYDGCQMTLFRSYNADPASLPDNYIKSIQEDYKGNLWILTGVGYVIYNSESETFDREVHAWLCEVGIDGTPALVYIDHNKNMWFYIKGKGCYLYIPESQLLYPLLFDTHQLPEGDITDIVECSKGILLVYNTGRLVCLDTRTNKIKWQQDDLARELGTDKQGIFTLFVDRDNDIWMYSPFGIWVYSPEQKKWLSWLANIIKRRSHNMVRAVSQDKQGRIWIGTDQDGIDILDKKTGEVRQLRNKAGDERSLQNNTVMVLYEDSSETMWVGTYKKGISYFNECAFKFGAEYIGDISCIEEDKEGYVWLGINDVGIIYRNSVTGNRAAFPQKGTDKLITDAIVCILKASDGKLWIGTFGGGLICYDNGRIIHYKKKMGRDIKLLGVARNEADGIEAYVCPMLIPSSHPLATVNDSYNAVFVHGDAVEDAMFFGRGAGELPTASAVVGDVFDIVRNILAGCCGRIGCTCYKNIPVKKMEDTHNRYFLRLKVEDRCGVLAEMTAIFAKYQVSVAQIIQKDTKVEGCAEVVVITEKVREGDFRTAIEELRNRDSVRKISTIIRVYGK